MSYLTTSHVASRTREEPARLRDLWHRARTPGKHRAVRLLDLGDSRSTCPYGWGYDVCPIFVYLWTRRFGNAPETPLTPTIHFGGSGQPAMPDGGILMGCSTIEGAPTQQTAACIPHGFGAGKPFALSPEVEQGPNFCLQHDFHAAHPGPDVIPRGIEYLKRHGHRCEIFVPRLPAQHTVIRWLQAEQPSSAGTYTAGTETQSGTIRTTTTKSVQGDVMSCLGPEGPVRSYLTPPAVFATPLDPSGVGSLYARWRIGSSSAATRVNILGALVRSADTRGFGYTNSAAGGRMVTSVLTECPLSFHLWRAYAPNVVSCLYGANDAGNGYSPAAFAAGAAALATWIKANLADDHGDAPLIIFESAPMLTNLTAGRLDALSHYAPALADFAHQVPGIIALNTSRAAAELGYTAPTHTADGVHYNALGARTVALARHNLWAKAIGLADTTARR